MSEFNDAYRKGEDYGLGRGVATDFALAADYFRIAADGGHIEAMCDLAELLIMDGSEVQNIPEGEKWLRKAVSAGSSAANCTLAKFLISRGSPFDGEPRTLLEAAVKSGNREAMFELASGLEWLVKDCEFSDTDAKEKAGRLMTLANDLLKRAAENGHAGARARLADFTHATNALLAEYGLFGKGLFHVMNSQEAYEGEDPSDDEGALNSTIPVDDFADQGDAETQLNLGYKYFEGLEVKKDLAQAVAWFRKAAEQGQMIAQFNLGCCYRYGDGVALDLLQAAAWFHKAADQGYAMAQHNLGTM